MPKKTYVTRKKKRAQTAAHSAIQPKEMAQNHGVQSNSPGAASSGSQGADAPPRLIWSLIDFETCRPVIRDLGKHVLDSKAHHAVDIAGCLAGVFAYTDENGLKGTLLAMPGMDTEAFIRLVDRGDAEEFTYIVKDGVKEFASVIKEGEA